MLIFFFLIFVITNHNNNNNNNCKETRKRCHSIWMRIGRWRKHLNRTIDTTPTTNDEYKKIS